MRHTVLLSLLLLLASAALPTLPDGTTCSTSASCTSRICKTRCCTTATPTNCAVCNAFGACQTCVAGYTAVNGQCVSVTKSAGAACNTNSECSSNNCKTHCCRSGIVSACTSCASGTGQCSGCPSTHYIAGAPGCALKKKPGEQCTANIHCKTGNCQSNRCCLSGMASQCSSCAASSGLCTACSSPLVLKSGGSAPGCVIQVGAGGVCSSNSMCTTNACKSGRCCNFQMASASQCTQCDSDGKCASCSGNYYVSGGACAAKKADGITCSQTSQCLSNVCETRCCNSPMTAAAQCTQCDSGGKCTSCSGNYYVSGGACAAKKSDGTTCSHTLQCLSNACKTRCCNSPMTFASHCTQCDSDGKCASCSGNYYVSGGACAAKKADGITCSLTSQCLSDVCESRCCNSPMAAAPQCTQCDSSGECTTCSGNYYVSGGACVPKKLPGSGCTQSSECLSNVCLNSYCCKNGVTATSCNSCTATGACDGCNTNFYLSGGQCSRQENDGNVCGASIHCISGLCLDSRCCKSGINNRLCTSCRGYGGRCSACPASHYIDSSGKCDNKKSDGVNCPSNVACTSGRCETRCCSSPPTAHCATCGLNGACTACVSMRYLVGTTCFAKRAAGFFCSDHGHQACISGKCHTNCCNSGMAPQCNECGTNGLCTSCVSSHWVSGGSCSPKIADGGRCTVQPACISGSCKSSRCCSATASGNCIACDSGGDCSSCSTSHYLDNSKQCREKKVIGTPCGSDGQCKLGECKTHCCTLPVITGCGRCSSTGSCDQCIAGYWLDGNVCREQEDAGANCTISTQCKSGLCAGQFCCNPSTMADCTQCAATTGGCHKCKLTHYLRSGNCVPRSPAGTACSDDDHCQSRFCRSGVCCVEGAVSQCTSCSTGGWCSACAPQWYVAGTICRHFGSRTVSDTRTESPPPTPSATPSSSTSRSSSPSSSRSTSLSSTLSMNDTETLTLESTASFGTNTHTAAATASVSLAATGSESVTKQISSTLTATKTRTGTPPLTETHQPTPTVSYSFTLTSAITATQGISASASISSTATQQISSTVSGTVSFLGTRTRSTPISSSVSMTLLELHAELLNGTTVESWVIGREPHSQVLKIQLTGERLDPTLFHIKQSGATNEARAIEVSFLANPLAANDTVSGPCTAYVTTREAMFGVELAANSSNETPAAVRQYVDRNTTVVATSERDIEVWFPPSPGFAMDRDTELTLWLTRGCLASRRPFMPVNFTLLETPVLKGVPDAVMDTSRAIADAAVAVGGIGSPAVATQLSRSTIILGLVECSPSDESLTVSQSPFGVELLDSGVGQYVGGAVLNHVASLLFAGLLVCIALAVGAQSGKGFAHGCEVARFPSLLAFSSMLLIEPTAMCCMVVLLYAGTAVKALGGVSLVLLVAMPLATLAYFRPKRGEFVYHPLWDEPRNAALLFFFGRCKWTDRDGPHSTGFCQRHRLFFGDYVGSRWYFLAVEMGMSIVCGAIDGLKLGLGRCNGVAIALFVVLLLYVVLLLVARPYNNAFLLVFAFTLAVLQLIGAGLMMVHLQFGSARAFVAAEWVSVACMWLLSLRMVFDIAPKTYLIYKAVRRAVGGAAAKLVRPRGKSQRFEDMRERVLYAMDDEKAPDLDTAVRAVDAREEALLADLDRILGDSNDDDTNFFPSDYEDDDDFYPPGYLDDDAPVYYEGGAGLGDYADGEFEQEMDSIDELLGGAMKRDPDALRFDDGGVGGSAEELWSSMVELLGPALETAGNFTATQQEQMSQRFKELDGELRRLKIAAADGSATAQSALERLPPNNQVLAMLDDSEATMLQHALEAVPGFEAQMLLRRLTTTRSLVAERVAISKEQQQQRDDVTTPLRPLSDIGVDRLVVGDDDVDLDNNTGKAEDVSEKMTTKAASSSRSPSQINSSCPSVEVSVSVTPTISVRGSVGDLVDLSADRDDL